MRFETLPLILIPALALGVRSLSPSVPLLLERKSSLIGPLREFILFDGYPLLVLSRRLGPGTRSCCGASRDLE